MKSKIFNPMLVVLLLTLGIIGCKKENDLASKSQISNNVILSSREAPEGVTVSKEGFLVFPSLESLGEFQSFVSQNSHAVIQEYLDSIGFESKGQNLYDPHGHSEYCETETCDEPLCVADMCNDESCIHPTCTRGKPREVEYVDYLFNEDNTVQVMGVIFKLSDNGEHVITLNEEYLDEYNYSNLVNEIFDVFQMNKFATNQIEEFDLFLEVAANPYGTDEQFDSQNGLAKGPFRTVKTTTVIHQNEWYDVYGNCWNRTWVDTRTRQYFFWIKVKDEVISGPITSVPCD